MQAWFSLAEAHFNEPWGYHIYWNKRRCNPRAVRFVVGCRWESPLQLHEKHGRVVIDGHFSYLVRKDLALQSRSLGLDEALLSSLASDKTLRNALRKRRDLPFARYLHVYYLLGHRDVYQNFFQTGWSEYGMSVGEYENCRKADGTLDVDAYIDAASRLSKNCLERILVESHENTVRKIAEAMEVKQCRAVQPNLIFGPKENFTEFAKRESGIPLESFEVEIVRSTSSRTAGIRSSGEERGASARLRS